MVNYLASLSSDIILSKSFVVVMVHRLYLCLDGMGLNKCGVSWLCRHSQTVHHYYPFFAFFCVFSLVSMMTKAEIQRVVFPTGEKIPRLNILLISLQNVVCWWAGTGWGTVHLRGTDLSKLINKGPQNMSWWVSQLRGQDIGIQCLWKAALLVVPFEVAVVWEVTC